MMKIKTDQMLKKISVFVSGLFFMAFGVALSVKADLGVSPISCVPYVYSLKFPFTIGELTIFLNTLFIVMQVILLHRKYRLIQLIQLPAVIVFGYFIDLTMYMLSEFYATSYGSQIFWCILSCIILAFGVFFIVKADLTYLPGEGLVVAIANSFQQEFGKMKIGLDSSMVIFGTLSSFLLIGHLQGIREGTFIAAIAVGYLVKFYSSRLTMVNMWLTKILNSEEIVQDISK